MAHRITIGRISGYEMQFAVQCSCGFIRVTFNPRPNAGREWCEQTRAAHLAETAQ